MPPMSNRVKANPSADVFCVKDDQTFSLCSFYRFVQSALKYCTNMVTGYYLISHKISVLYLTVFTG